MKKHKRALSLLLIICIMCCAFFGSVESANALVLNPWTIALCGTILCAMGLTFTDTSAMEAAVNSFASSLDAETLTLIIDSATTLASGVSDGIFTVTQSIVDALINWVSVVRSEDEALLSFEGVYTIHPFDFPAGKTVIASYPISKFLVNKPAKPADKSLAFFAFPYIGFYLYEDGSSYSCYHFYDTPDDRHYYLNTSIYNPEDSVDLVLDLSRNLKNYSLEYVFPSSQKIICGTAYDLTSVSISTSCSIPFDSTWAPGSSDEEKALVAGTDVVVPGGIVNSDGVLASDVIVGMSASNVRANSGVNTDVIAGTGTITGTGEGTGIFEGIGSLVLDIPLVGTIASTLSGILEAIRGFFDVSKFDLNFDSLKIGLTKVFPFCIPFDFFNAIKMFSSDASAFVFDINLQTEYFTIDHTVDLTPFRLPILFFRYVVVFWFGFILISRTKDFMKW